MNRERCPWCGKIIDKNKDKISWGDAFASPSVPRFLRKAICGHCGRKYGQVPFFQFLLKIGLVVVAFLILALVFQSGFLFIVAFLPCFLTVLTPYSKLDENGKCCEENEDLLCEIKLIEKYGDIKPYELYFLDDSFDDFEPFFLASPICVYHVSKKDGIVLGAFSYMHEKNYNYIGKDVCDLYDTDMNLVAKIKFITDVDTE